MSDIDLIPQAYRTRRWQVRWMKHTAYLIVGLTGTLILTWTVLGVAIGNARADVEALQNKLSHTAQQRADIERLSAEKTELERQFRLLSNLRSGTAAGDMFVTVDQALTSDDVWFRNWKFERAGIMVGEEVRTTNTGYFVVVPDGADQLASNELRIQTHMEIRGQALDHSALSSFVRRLFVQPGIDDIRIRRTSLIDRNRSDTVDFELAVVLNTDVRIE
jgi:cell division protein FtsB